MSGAKHTPGPWTVDAEEFTTDIYAGEKRVAVVYGLGDMKSKKTMPFNAALIAGAPIMLALLEELVSIEGPQPGHREWYRRVVDVIAKAKDGAQ